MKASICRSLKELASQLAAVYSDPKKAPKNKYGIKFEVDEVIVCSELVGCIVLKKSNGQRAVIKCEWINYNVGGKWHWSTLRYDHLYGMQQIINIMHRVEQQNYLANTNPIGGLPDQDANDTTQPASAP